LCECGEGEGGAWIECEVGEKMGEDEGGRGRGKINFSARKIGANSNSFLVNFELAQ